MLNVERDGPVLRVALNRPEVRNAFNDELIGALTQVFAAVTVDMRAIVLSGRGQSFCAGGDLVWMQQASEYTEHENYEDALRLARLFQIMCDCPAPIIARVHGAAFGGGCGLVAASDIAIAGDQALFAFSEVRLGLVPATISQFVIPKIGQGNARALFTSGEAFGPDRALQIGLVHETVSTERLDEAVEAKLRAILGSGPKAISESKRLAQQPPQSVEDAARLLALVRAGAEAKEGVAAFLDRRTPYFKAER